MTEVAEDTQPAMTYPSKQQYSRWKTQAAERDMSMSEWMQAMIEAGIKVNQGLEMSLQRDESTADLREQRNDLKKELDRARTRIERLEERLHRTERQTVKQFIKENPGVNYPEVLQHVVDTVPERVVEHIEALQGEAISIEEGHYHPINRPNDTEPPA